MNVVSNSHLQWIEKYRPSNMDELFSHEYIKNSIMNGIETNQILHYLFYGSPGTGKTSMALIIAKVLYGDNYDPMVLNLNASDERGIGIVRGGIKTFVKAKSQLAGLKFVILDEMEEMTSDAQGALRTIMEKYIKVARFILICNNTEKVIPALQSRCVAFHFKPLQNSFIIEKLQYVCKQENLKFQNDALQAISEISKGDLRASINLLQLVSMQEDSNRNPVTEITCDLVYSTTAKPTPKDIQIISGYLLDKTLDFKATFDLLYYIIQNKSISLADLVDLVFNYFYSRNYSVLVDSHNKHLTNKRELSKKITETNNKNWILDKMDLEAENNNPKSIITSLATIQSLCSKNVNEKILLGNFVGCFKRNI